MSQNPLCLNGYLVHVSAPMSNPWDGSYCQATFRTPRTQKDIKIHISLDALKEFVQETGFTSLPKTTRVILKGSLRKFMCHIALAAPIAA